MSTVTPKVPQNPDFFTVSEALTKAKEITRQIFGNMQCQDSEDAELPGDRYFHFLVVATGSLEQICRLSDEWHRQISEFSPILSGLFRLTIDIQE